jgi:hypothetical protein
MVCHNSVQMLKVSMYASQKLVIKLSGRIVTFRSMAGLSV